MLLRIIPAIAYFIIKCIAVSLRLDITGAEAAIKGKAKGQNYVFAFWHNRFLMMPYYYVKLVSHPSISVLTSRSKDGEYISRLLHKFGFHTVRGSSSSGGNTALRTLIRELEKGYDVAVTPDGPRGPRYIVQTGVITLASLTGCPIIPVSYNIQHKKMLGTWDRFIIPYLFSRGTFKVGTPIAVSRDITDLQKETSRKELETKLLALTKD